MTAQEFVMIRKQLGLTQEALAESLGYSRNSVARWETNRRPIRSIVALRMTQLFTTVEWMKRGVGEEDPEAEASSHALRHKKDQGLDTGEKGV